MARNTEGDVQHERAEQRAATKEELLAKKPRRAQIEVLLDDDLVIEHDRKLDEIQRVKKNGSDPSRVAELEEELSEILQAISAATKVITVQSIGAKAYDALVDAHPPTDEQIERDRKEHAEQQAALPDDARTPFRPAPYNTDTFPVALIAASIVEPTLTKEDVQTIWDSWNTGERGSLFFAAMDVNSMTRRVANLGKGSG